MTPEQFESTMQFIVEQQAQLTTKMQRHDDAIAEMEKSRVEMEKSRVKTEQEIQTATNLIGRLASAMTELTERTSLLAQREDKFELRVDSLARRMDNLAEMQAGTEERLNSFITFGEKYISSRNGGSKPTA